ncbi:fimbrial protein [Caballeronia sp. INDeC2]|nr:fimbrial protein [Caballeronia sp. INDeC2]
MSLTFFAQYYRLGVAVVSPGDVHAIVIFTMNYQ